ncbi:hypothetical protein BGZ46_010859 [Entomortierella lignicola]|nr:hypothetical protein BGZ46_010859 [Entomortierella lignicola]
MSQQDHPAYLGCFVENTFNPDLSGEPPLIITRPEACFTHCSIGTFKYAAIRNRTYCTCGDTYNKYGVAPVSACSTACPEEQSVFDYCGGPEANSIYNVGMIIPKASLPVPSVRPPGDDQTTIDGSNVGTGDSYHQLSRSKSSRAIVIFGAVAGAMIIVIGVLLCLRRRRRNMTQSSKLGGSWSIGKRMRSMDEKGGAIVGHSWFEKRGKGSDGYEDRRWGYHNNDDEDMWQSQVQTGQDSMEEQLFEGFESSVLMEDQHHHQHQHQPYQNQYVVENVSIPEDLHHSSDSLTTINSQKSKPSSTFSKIGNKFSHLRVKTGYTSSVPLGRSLPLTPISPISPVSPASTSSSSSNSGQAGSQLQPPSPVMIPTIGREDHISSPLRYAERSPSSATPSFSLTSSPIPGPSSNSREPTVATSTTPSFEEHNDSNRYNFMDIYVPPSPVSPTSPIMPPEIPPQLPLASQTMSALSLTSTSISPTWNQKQQKQHRSNLIKDLILQGDSMLEDKEMAHMAQYQPHHCRQQQQHQQSRQGSGASLTIKTKDPKPRSSPIQVKHSKEYHTTVELDTGASPGALLAVPTETPRDSLAKNHNQSKLSPIDTNYLAPPPRILIHRAL